MKLNIIPARSIIRAIQERNNRPSIQFRDGSNSDPIKQAKDDFKAFSVVMAFIAFLILAMMVFDK